jgi:hypothetical protein
MTSGRAYVAERSGDDFWLLWWFPPGSNDSVVRRIYDWADVARAAAELGIDVADLHWAGASMRQMITKLGPPPHSEIAASEPFETDEP